MLIVLSISRKLKNCEEVTTAVNILNPCPMFLTTTIRCRVHRWIRFIRWIRVHRLIHEHQEQVIKSKYESPVEIIIFLITVENTGAIPNDHAM